MLLRHTCQLIAVALTVHSMGHTIAADIRVGSRVFLKLDANPIMDSRALGPSEIPIPAFVTEITDGKLKIERATIKKSEALAEDDALTYYTERIQEKRAKEYRAMVWRERGLLDNALDDANQAVDEDPTSASAFRNRGDILLDMGDVSQALKDYTRAINLDPRFARAYSSRGIARSDDAKSAIRDFSEAIRIDPVHAPYYKNRALALSATGDTVAAAVDLHKAIEIDSSYATAYYQLSKIYQIHEQTTDAILEIDKALDLNPGNSRYWIFKAELCAAKKQWAQRVFALNKAVEIDPEFTDALFARGAALIEGEHEAAILAGIGDLEKVTRLEPKNPRVHTKLAAAYVKQGALDQALKHHTFAIELDPSSAELYCERASFYCLHMDKYELGLADATAAVSIDPRSAEGYWNRAVCLDFLNSGDSAIADVDKAIAIKPIMLKYHISRAIINVRRDDHKAAHADLDMTKKFDLTDEGCSERSRVYFLMKDYQSAIDSITEAIRINSTRTRYYRLRAVYRNALIPQRSTNSPVTPSELQMAEDVFSDYTKAIELDPNNHLALYAKAKFMLYLADRNLSLAVPFIKKHQEYFARSEVSKACTLTHWRRGAYIEVLAAYYAIFGEFTKAVEYQTRAVEATELPGSLQTLELYKTEKLPEFLRAYRGSEGK